MLTVTGAADMTLSQLVDWFKGVAPTVASKDELKAIVDVLNSKEVSCGGG